MFLSKKDFFLFSYCVIVIVIKLFISRFVHLFLNFGQWVIVLFVKSSYQPYCLNHYNTPYKQATKRYPLSLTRLDKIVAPFFSSNVVFITLRIMYQINEEKLQKGLDDVLNSNMNFVFSFFSIVHSYLKL